MKGNNGIFGEPSEGIHVRIYLKIPRKCQWIDSKVISVGVAEKFFEKNLRRNSERVPVERFE